MHYGMNDAFAILGFAVFTFASQGDRGSVAALTKASWLETLGQWSYSIYMLHIPTLSMMQLVWPKIFVIPLGLSSGVANFSLAMTCISVTTVLAWASFRFFETPIRRAITSPGLNKVRIGQVTL
jgi:peptidoglycan/LPS O-acetylase OafA/YrhL